MKNQLLPKRVRLLNDTQRITANQATYREQAQFRQRLAALFFFGFALIALAAMAALVALASVGAV